jgi:hypothetical protein
MQMVCYLTYFIRTLYGHVHTQVPIEIEVRYILEVILSSLFTYEWFIVIAEGHLLVTGEEQGQRGGAFILENDTLGHLQRTSHDSVNMLTQGAQKPRTWNVSNNLQGRRTIPA